MYTTEVDIRFSTSYYVRSKSLLFIVMSCRVRLTRSLFSSHDILAGCLFHIRGLCESASDSFDNSNGSPTGISLVVVSRAATVTLTEFEEMQKKQRILSESQLRMLRDSIVDLVHESCSVSENT
jgi:hypothetical protein